MTPAYLSATALPTLLTVRVGDEVVPWIGPRGVRHDVNGSAHWVLSESSEYGPDDAHRIRLDLRRPEAFGHARDCLALAVGVTGQVCGWNQIHNGQWLLSYSYVEDGGLIVESFVFTEEEIPGDTGGEDYRVVPGITTITDPALALLAACLRVGTP